MTMKTRSKEEYLEMARNRATVDEVMQYYPFDGVHWAADLFPLMDDEAFAEFLEDMEANGQSKRIVIDEERNLLVDGRNRLVATYMLDMEPSFEKVFLVDPASFVISENLHRRHLTKGAIALIAQKYRANLERAAKERQREAGRTFGRGKPSGVELPPWMSDEHPTTDNEESTTYGGEIASGKICPPTTNNKLGEMFGVAPSYVKQAKAVQQFAPDLEPAVMAGKMRIDEAAKEARQRKKAAEQASGGKPRHTAMVTTLDGRQVAVEAAEKPTFNRTNDSIGWADWSWNPVTGCRHGCKFCYAEELANSARLESYYPLGFEPALREYALAAPRNTPIPADPDKRRVFVCSMADLFGKWVPDEWIQKVFEAAKDNPRWTYIFLTKWPKRYHMLATLPNAWFGASIVRQSDVLRVAKELRALGPAEGRVRWVSMEPMIEPIDLTVAGPLDWLDLVAIGSQTAANGQPAIPADFEAVASVVRQCRDAGIKVWLKHNLMEQSPGMKVPRELPE